jgi:hypothetical protein
VIAHPPPRDLRNRNWLRGAIAVTEWVARRDHRDVPDVSLAKAK